MKKKMLSQKNNKDLEKIFHQKIGFSYLWKLLKEIIVRDKKPLIGHNMFYDLLFLINNMEKSLTAEDYFEFKNTLHKEVFPIIFDTKLLSLDFKLQTSPLEDLYQYMTIRKTKNYYIEYEEELRKSHNAFWDAFMAGVCYSEMRAKIQVKNYLNCIALYKNNICAFRSDVRKSEKILNLNIFIFKPENPNETNADQIK